MTSDLLSHAPPDDVGREPLRIAISHPDAETAVVTPGGEADVNTVPGLRRALFACLDAGHRRVLVDLDHLTFLDAATLGVLVEFRQAASSRGATFVASCHSGLGRILLQTAGLECLLDRTE